MVEEEEMIEMSVRVKHIVYTCLVYNSCTLYML